MEKWNFGDCKISKLKKKFQLRQVDNLPCLESWLSSPFPIEDLEKNILKRYQKTLIGNVRHWNEQDLSLNFIGPMIALAGFGDEEYFNAFSERLMTTTINEIELSGRVDGIIAAGKEEPELPYFCLQEYKKETNPEGDPAAQALAAMLVAQHLNEVKMPIYGAYINGRSWYFMVLEGKEFSISLQYDATKNEIFDIFRILNGLRIMLEKKFNNQNI